MKSQHSPSDLHGLELHLPRDSGSDSAKADTATDPICGMTVDTSKALSAVREGQTYYFCCEGCRQKFLSGQTSPGGGQLCCGGHSGAKVIPSSTAAWFCPMCPGVESDSPGDCPVCGMALEQNPLVAAAGGQDSASEELALIKPAALLTAGVVVLAMGPMVGIPVWNWMSSTVNGWLQAALATPVVWWFGRSLMVRGARSLRSGNLNMFTLIGLGTLAAWSYSLFLVIAGSLPQAGPAHTTGHAVHELYFEAAAVIVTLTLLGQWMEGRARQRTGQAIRELLALAPAVALRVTASGEEQEVPLSEVRAGDRLRIRPGAKVPVDGTVVEGTTSIDESMLTGESLPVRRQPGEALTGGTLNTSGSVVMEATRVGSETVLSRIVQLVAEAQRSRAPIQKLADSVAGVFVPVVVGVSVLAFFGWWLWGGSLSLAISHAVAVLIIACPCALGLATPMSITVGMGRGAREGVLIRDAATLERLQAANVLLVDKTGTVTEGRHEVIRVEPVSELPEQELLQLAAAVEAKSEHPLAQAIVRTAKARDLSIPEVRDFQSMAGDGVSGIVNGKTILIGQPEFLSKQGVSGVDAALKSWPEAQAGASRVLVSRSGVLAGALMLADPVKETSAQAVRELHELGLRIIMLSGDDERTVAEIARQVGIDASEGRVRPEEKLARVKTLQAEGKVVAMAGDGINDAPALAAADVGLAMSNGTDVAIESADVTLLKGDLRGITRAVVLSRDVGRNIRQNLFFAFVYNGIGVPLAAGVLTPWTGWQVGPMFAATAMSLSSVSVIANSLRLRSSR